MLHDINHYEDLYKVGMRVHLNPNIPKFIKETLTDLECGVVQSIELRTSMYEASVAPSPRV